ncbi:hypothetical protein ACFCV4_00015, partial [Enterococcus faecium]|uniref:hypothetical protein n=1 Tax=Enterococcus faecium TaxID=1352 RepID=UPI0035DF9305
EKLAFEHRLPRGRKPAVSLRVTRNNLKKKRLKFVEYFYFCPWSWQENTIHWRVCHLSQLF